MKVIPRSDWTSRTVRLSAMALPQRDLFVHHTADAGPPNGRRATVAQEKEYMRRVEAFHIGSRGMAAVAYSFLVMPSGRVYEGRGWGKAGGHTLGHNTTSHAICFAGNFQTQKPTDAALESARELIAQGVAKGAVSRRFSLHGHRDVGQTACPGNNLYAKLGELRRPAKPVKVAVRVTVTGKVDRARVAELMAALRNASRGYGVKVARTT